MFDGEGQECRHNYPLTNRLCDDALFVCYCVAAERGLCTRGPRSLLGTYLPKRNHEYLNATSRIVSFFTNSNSDLKFPHRAPITSDTHPVLLYDAQKQSCVDYFDAGAMA